MLIIIKKKKKLYRIIVSYYVLQVFNNGITRFFFFLSFLSCFLQWVDCVSQLLRMYPFAFEFSSVCTSKTCSLISRNRLSLYIQHEIASWLVYCLMIQAFLVDFLDCVLSCRFGNFLCNRYFLFEPWTRYKSSRSVVFEMHFMFICS